MLLHHPRSGHEPPPSRRSPRGWPLPLGVASCCRAPASKTRSSACAPRWKAWLAQARPAASVAKRCRPDSTAALGRRPSEGERLEHIQALTRIPLSSPKTALEDPLTGRLAGETRRTRHSRGSDPDLARSALAKTSLIAESSAAVDPGGLPLKLLPGLYMVQQKTDSCRVRSFGRVREKQLEVSGLQAHHRSFSNMVSSARGPRPGDSPCVRPAWHWRQWAALRLSPRPTGGSLQSRSSEPGNP